LLDSLLQEIMSQELPHSNKVYKDPEYWNSRFESEDTYEWLVNYKDVRQELLPILKTFDNGAKLLQLGCGNSNFANDIYSDGFENITNIDISDVCVQKMKLKYPHMTFETMDMTAMTFEDASFDVVIEKATLDSLLVDCKSPWDLSDQSYELVMKCLREVKRVMKPGGKFISLTFSQPHFRVPLLASSELGWSISVDKFSNKDSLVDYYLMICQAGDPGLALSRWSVSPGPVIQTNDAWSSSDEETDFINKFQNSCFASDSEDDEVCHSADS